MITEDSSLTFIKKQIRNDLLYIRSFCQQKKIKPSLKNFLEYKELNSSIPSCIYYFFGNNYCKQFFFNSKTFQKMYYSLPQDFKNDIGSIKTIQLLTKTEYNIEQYLKSILRNDFIGTKNDI